MGQLATLYRITRTDFENNKNDQQQLISQAKGFATFDQTFMGLDFVLKKGEDNRTQEMIDEVFNPAMFVESGSKLDFENLSDDELHDLFSVGNMLCFLPADKVRAINLIIEKLTKQEIGSRFDPEELNENDIYPSVWNFDNSPEQAFNLNHILEDFEQLKNLFKQASQEEDYILQFIG